MIKELNIITAQGVKTYKVGKKVPFENNVIAEIKKGVLYFTGDPFDHYIGYDDKGKMLFSVNCLAPCDVVYGG